MMIVLKNVAFNALSIKIPMAFSIGIEIHLKVHMEFQGTGDRRKNLGNKTHKVVSLTLFDFKTYCEAIIIKAVWLSIEAGEQIDGIE